MVKNTLLALCLVIMGLLSFYVYKQISGLRPVSNVIETTTPLQKDINPSTTMKTETIAVNVTIAFMGNQNYNLSFTYPENWLIQRADQPASANKTMKNCKNYTLTDVSKNVSIAIEPVCTDWSATYSSYPQGATVVQKKENQGNRGDTSYWVRYFNQATNAYTYAEAFVSPEESISENTKIMDAITVPSSTPKLDDSFFIPVKVKLTASGGTAISEKDIAVSDSIIKSLKFAKI